MPKYVLLFIQLMDCRKGHGDDITIKEGEFER